MKVLTIAMVWCGMAILALIGQVFFKQDNLNVAFWSCLVCMNIFVAAEVCCRDLRDRITDRGMG
jgi:hypothetical protein